MTASRRVLAVASVVAVAAIVTVLVVVVERHTTTARVPAFSSLVTPGPEFRAADGVVYQRIASVSIDTTKQATASVPLPAGDGPISIYATCALADPHAREDSGIALATSPTYAGLDGVFSCRRPHPRIEEFSRSELASVLRFAQMATLADTPSTAPAAWVFAIYQWVVPKTLRPAPPAPTMPATIAVGNEPYTLATAVSGVWPRQRSVPLTIPTSKGWILAVACTSAIAGRRIYFDLAVAQMVDSDGVTCSDVSHGGAIGLDATTNVQTTGATTVNFTLGFDPIYLMRGGSWSVGMYHP